MRAFARAPRLEPPEARATDEDRGPARGEGRRTHGGTATRSPGDLALAEDQPGQVGLRGRGSQPLPQRPPLAIREVVQRLLAGRFPELAHGVPGRARDVEGGRPPDEDDGGTGLDLLAGGERWQESGGANEDGESSGSRAE